MTDHLKRRERAVETPPRAPKPASDADRLDRRFRVDCDPLEALKAVVTGLSEKES